MTTKSRACGLEIRRSPDVRSTSSETTAPFTETLDIQRSSILSPKSRSRGQSPGRYSVRTAVLAILYLITRAGLRSAIDTSVIKRWTRVFPSSPRAQVRRSIASTQLRRTWRRRSSQALFGGTPYESPKTVSQVFQRGLRNAIVTR